MKFAARQSIPLVQLQKYMDSDYEKHIDSKLYELIGKEIGNFYGYETEDILIHDKKEKEVRIIAFTDEQLSKLFLDLNVLFYESEQLASNVKHLIEKRLLGE